MKWAEFKKEWNELEKSERETIIANICGTLAATLLILVGLIQYVNYSDLILDDYKYALNGVFVCAAGFWIFNVFCIKTHYRMMHRISDRVDKLEESMDKKRDASEYINKP